jgi:hypothetical protein
MIKSSDGKTVYRVAGISSVMAAAMVAIADYLLEFSQNVELSAAIIEPVWLEIPEWRFQWSIYLCVLFVPFYIAGFWMIYRALSPTHKKTATAIFLLGSYGVVMGSPLIHTMISINPIVYKYGNSFSNEAFVFAQHLINDKFVPLIMPALLVHYLITWIIPPLLFFIAVISGKTIYPRWSAFLNPLFFFIFFALGMAVFPDIFRYLYVGSINKGNVVFFLMPAVLLWQGDRMKNALLTPDV